MRGTLQDEPSDDARAAPRSRVRTRALAIVNCRLPYKRTLPWAARQDGRRRSWRPQPRPPDQRTMRRSRSRWCTRARNRTPQRCWRDSAPLSGSPDGVVARTSTAVRRQADRETGGRFIGAGEEAGRRPGQAAHRQRARLGDRIGAAAVSDGASPDGHSVRAAHRDLLTIGRKREARQGNFGLIDQRPGRRAVLADIQTPEREIGTQVDPIGVLRIDGADVDGIYAGGTGVRRPADAAVVGDVDEAGSRFPSSAPR